MKILIVASDEYGRASEYADAVSRLGEDAEIVRTDSALGALKGLQDHRQFDRAIISGSLAPGGMSGWELVAQLASNERYDRTPVNGDSPEKLYYGDVAVIDVEPQEWAWQIVETVEGSLLKLDDTESLSEWLTDPVAFREGRQRELLAEWGIASDFETI